MRVATMIISLCLVAIIGLQSCTVGLLGELSDDELTSQGGAVGMLVAFLFLLGGALVLGLPRLAMVLFLVAGLFALVAGATTEFGDMTVWGVVAVILAVMSYFGHREKSKAKANATA